VAANPFTDSEILSFVLVLARVAAFIGVLPLFGQHQLPRMIKLGLATALTIFWFGSTPLEQGLEQPNFLLSILLIVREIGIGIFLALIIGFLLVPARIAGSYVGQEIGISMEPVTQSGSDQATIMTAIFEAMAVILFFMLNLHHFLILVLHHSFHELAGKISLLELPTEFLIQWIDQITEYGLLIMAPIGVVGFAVVISLFLLNKAAPSMNLFSVGMPLRIGLGLLAIFFFLPVMWKSIEKYFLYMIDDVDRLIVYFW